MSRRIQCYCAKVAVIAWDPRQAYFVRVHCDLYACQASSVTEEARQAYISQCTRDKVPLAWAPRYDSLML